VPIETLAREVGMKRAELRQGDLWGRSRWGSYRNLESGISHARQQARMIPRVTLIAGVLVGLAGAARADPAGCRAAIDQYNSATSDISSALRRCAACVSGSQGRDDCSSEFRRLRSAQSDFESAVSEYESECGG
jgi:hypothetical protein